MGTLRGLITLVLLLLFVALVVWLWRRGNKHRFDAAARMPLEDDAHGEGQSENQDKKV